MTLAVTLYALMAGLCLTWVFRVACVLHSRGRKLLDRFDLFSGCESPPSESRHQVLFGRVIWKSAFKWGLDSLYRSISLINIVAVKGRSKNCQSPAGSFRHLFPIRSLCIFSHLYNCGAHPRNRTGAIQILSCPKHIVWLQYGTSRLEYRGGE